MHAHTKFLKFSTAQSPNFSIFHPGYDPGPAVAGADSRYELQWGTNESAARIVKTILRFQRFDEFPLDLPDRKL